MDLSSVNCVVTIFVICFVWQSPWNQFFQDGELKQTILQDIVRTHPDQLFFKDQKIQSVMTVPSPEATPWMSYIFSF